MKWLMYRSSALLLVLTCGCAHSSAEPATAPVAEASPTQATTETSEGGLGLKGEEAPPKRRIGKLPKEVIRDTIRGEHQRIQACYHAARERKPELAGKLVLRFTIEEGGGVEELTIRDDSTVLDIPMRECVLDIFRKLEFPKPEGGIVLVNYPFEFEVESPTSGKTSPATAPKP